MRKSNKNISYKFEQTGKTSARIYANDEPIAEIQDLQLCNVRFKPGGLFIIGATVPMPLYWWQYANHEDPERNTGSNGKLQFMENNQNELNFRCQSSNESGSALSEYAVKIYLSEKFGCFVFEVNACLTIPEGKKWLVTANSSHGELEFCNFWPEGSFTIDSRIPKRYQACFVQSGKSIVRLPHHHLETSDKHNIKLNSNDRFMWLLEDENPVLEIISEQPVSAGLCAYMWDAHFGYRICENFKDQKIEGKKEFRASFRLYSINRNAGDEIVKHAQDIPVPEINEIPIYVEGLNTFARTLKDLENNIHELWPWMFESENGTGKLDLSKGYDDQCSLKIKNTQSSNSQWMATTLGPAFGQLPFADAARYKLSAYVYLENITGTVDIAIRLHRTGKGSVFELADYELFIGEKTETGSQQWQYLEIVSPIISPAPDRMHLLLRLQGVGSCWFDNVLFEVLK